MLQIAFDLHTVILGSSPNGSFTFFADVILGRRPWYFSHTLDDYKHRF